MTRIPTVTEPARDELGPRELSDYEDYKEGLLHWLSRLGKNPAQRKGYADGTVQNVTYHIDRFYRWKWDRTDHYTTSIDPEETEDYIEHLVLREDDLSDNYISTTQKCLKRVFKFWNHQRGKNFEWDSDFSFSVSQHAPKDFLTRDERQAIRDAALQYGAVPSRSTLSADERDRWTAHLAQRFEKPKEDVSEDDWNRANSWKIPSLVWTSLDTGLRPVEVERSRVQWVDVDNQVLRIPKEESSKNEGNWTVALSDRTAAALDRWLTERETYEKYDGSDAIWLTKYGNPYNNNSLSGLMERLFETAGIDGENRQTSWYTIRHSVGTYMAREEGLAAAQAQLRHRSVRTTMKYDQAPVEDRRDALDSMG